jgi:hypothetical protein
MLQGYVENDLKTFGKAKADDCAWAPGINEDQERLRELLAGNDDGAAPASVAGTSAVAPAGAELSTYGPVNRPPAV